MSRKKIVAGNWKMFTTVTEGIELARDITSEMPIEGVTLMIAPPFTHLYAIKRVVTGTPLLLAAQNCHPAEQGPFTGEVSVPMLKSIGVDAVIIGHSERRQHFKEGHAFLQEKVDAVLANDLHVVFCCGEPLSVRNEGEAKKYVGSQLEESLFHLDETQFENVVIAYEPIWAIGTGVTATPEQAQEMHQFIRSQLVAKYGIDLAESVTILYGGSVKPGNAGELFAQPDVDGGLVGGASLKADSFIEIAKSY